MRKYIYSRSEFIQLLGSEAVAELEANGLQYQLAGGRYVIDIRDLPDDLNLDDWIEEEEEEEFEIDDDDEEKEEEEEFD